MRRTVRSVSESISLRAKDSDMDEIQHEGQHEAGGLKDNYVDSMTDMAATPTWQQL